MKKLVAISVLFAGLAMAVSAQDGGWSNPWKVGLSLTYDTAMFYHAKATGSNEETQKTTTSPTATYPLSDGTTSTEYGKYAKGVSHFFPAQHPTGGDNRMSLSLNNSGENYAMSFNITIDDWLTDLVNEGYGGRSILQMLLDGHIRDDWGIKGNAGIFSVGIGPWASTGGWADANASWSSWLGPNTVNRFGLWLYSGDGLSDITHVDYADYKHFNDFRTLGTWGEPFWVAISLGDNYRFALGHMLGWSPAIGGPTDNRSSMNGTFMLSGSPIDAINFDLFYAIQGKDDDTSSLPVGSFGYNAPNNGKWLNNVGVYVQVKGIENVNLSVGYSGWFNIYEAGSFVPDSGVRDAKKVAFKAPLTSGVDLRLGYSGIDKIGLKFNNNVTFAKVEGEKFDATKHQDSVVLSLKGNDSAAIGNILGEGLTQDWFTWTSTLRAELGFIEGVGLEVAFGNILSVAGTTTDTKKTDTAGTTTTTVKGSTKQTFNEFTAVVGAKYGIGNVNLGIALSLGIASRTLEKESTETVTTTGGSSTKTETSSNKVDNVVTFGVPIFVTVSF